MRRTSLTLFTILCSLAVFGLTGCVTKPVMNIHNAPVPLAKNKRPTMKQTEEAIVEAGASRGWVMEAKKPGLIIGNLTVRGKHHATVKVTYTTKTYNIDYVDSRNLKYKDGKIHRNYNNWINNLDQRIRTNLATIQYR